MTDESNTPQGQHEPTNDANDLEDLTGPFYGEEDTARWLGLSVSALRDRADRLEVLQLMTGDGAAVFPAWQFTEHRRVIKHLPDVLRRLAAGTADRWTWALWLTAPDEDLNDKTAWKWLAEGGDPNPVLLSASQDAARWRQ